MRIRIPKALKRLGCGLLLVAWFALLMLPCVAIVLVTDGEIVLTHSDVPNDEFRVWLIQQPHERGIALSNSRRVSGTDGSTCTIVDGSFLMWEGQQAESPHYCSCYKQQGGAWNSTAEGDEACQLAESRN
ncbi:MAG TPA: hypothetical protein VKQ72_21430 [Aggregatilineales bacterium]|nr:hypothetical protein [Aggregatilineales bacterium]